MDRLSKVWEELTRVGRCYRLPDRAATSLANQADAFERSGITSPEVGFLRAQAEALKSRREHYKEEAATLARGTPQARWVEERKGLGSFTFIALGQASTRTRLVDFRNPSCVWKHFGLDPGPLRECAGIRRAYITQRLIDPVIRVGEGALRGVYDERRARTEVTHPPMGDRDADCPSCRLAWELTEAIRGGRHTWRERKGPALDCSNACLGCGGQNRAWFRASGVDYCRCPGGPEGPAHWTDMHRHRDAIRITSKAILTDLWRMEHGQAPRVGHSPHDTQKYVAGRGSARA